MVVSPKLLPGSTLALLLTAVLCVSCSNGNSANDPTLGPPKPQIPKEDFEWHGVFKGSAVFSGTVEDLSAPQVVAELTIRGQWQGEHFNVYMEQGNRESDSWVENLVHNGKFYTITHKWHTDAANDFLELCFENTVYNEADRSDPLPITVDGLNSILTSSRFVALEVIDGKPMNHFRATCLAAAAAPTEDNSTPFPPPFWPIKIFSDIYVPQGQLYPWTKWLQYGDGVGPDPQNDEWFLLDEWNSEPAEIVLPEHCQDWSTFKRYVQQTACTNLIPKKPKS
jgi:hypothetical protein